MLALQAMTVRASRAAILQVHAASSLRISAVPPQASASIAAAITANVAATSCGVAPKFASVLSMASPVEVPLARCE